MTKLPLTRVFCHTKHRKMRKILSAKTNKALKLSLNVIYNIKQQQQLQVSNTGMHEYSNIHSHMRDHFRD